MNKVIRTAKISNRTVRLADYHQDEVRAKPVSEGFEEGLGVELDDESIDEKVEQILGDGETDEASEEAAPDATEATEGDPETEDVPDDETGEQDGPLMYSASQVEDLVQERVKEFEARFQSENEAAQKSGHEAGMTEGFKEGKAESEKEVEALRALVEDLQLQWEDHFKNTDQWIVDLSLAIAQKVVGVTVEHTSEPVLETVRKCLDDLVKDADVTIRINPEDAQVIRENQDHWLRTHLTDKPVIKEDPEISRGGCIVETQTGDVDAQIEEQMSKLKAALLDAIRSGNNSE